MEKLAHEVEIAVLDGARNRALTITSDGFDIILQSVDYLELWLNHLEADLQQHAVPAA